MLITTKAGNKVLDYDESDLWMYIKSKGIDGRVARRLVREIYVENKQLNIDDLDAEILQKMRK